MIKHVLVVCTGNICRSPIAEALFSKALAGSSITVGSAGIAALVGYGADPLSKDVSQEHGLDLSGHVARQVTRGMLMESDLILTLDNEHQNWIKQRFPEFFGRAHKLGRWQGNRDIADPYRQPKAAFDTAYREIEQDVNKWLERLQKKP